MMRSRFTHLTYFHFFYKPHALFAVASQMSKPKKTLYQVLEVPSTAPQSNIRKNYLKLAKIFHPDVYKGSDKTRFEQIKKAYETLSDVQKRQQYDQQIGLRKKSSPSEDSEFQTTAQNAASSEQVNKQNNFTYDTQKQQQVNIDQEYEKFFKKKKQTDFQQIRLHEQEEFKRMNQNQRIRFRFRELYTADGAQIKVSNTQRFQQLLDDQIDQRNFHYQDMQKKKEKLDKIYSEKGINKQKIIVYAAAGIFALIFYPLLFSFWTKYRLQQEQKKKMLELMENMRIKALQADIRSRFQY